MKRKEEDNKKKSKTSMEGAPFCQHYYSSNYWELEYNDLKSNTFLGSSQVHVWILMAHAIAIPIQTFLF